MNRQREANLPNSKGPAITILHTAVPMLSLLETISMSSMIPSKMESSDRKRMMAAPDVQMKQPCCWRSQNLKENSAVCVCVCVCACAFYVCTCVLMQGECF